MSLYLWLGDNPFTVSVKCRDCSPNETLEALFEAALDFGGGHLEDDAAVVIIERCTDEL